MKGIAMTQSDRVVRSRDDILLAAHRMAVGAQFAPPRGDAPGDPDEPDTSEYTP